MIPELIAPLSEELRRAVLRAALRRRYRKGDTIFHEGDPAEALHFLVKGRVAVRCTTPLGDTVTLNVLGTGANFGELALVGPGAHRSASVVALEPVETLVLTRGAFEELRRTHPDVRELLIAQLAARVRDLSAQLVEALHLSAEVRTLRRLADLGELYPLQDDGTIAVVLTQEDLATMAGTTRPTANRVLQGLVSDGVISLSRGRITILRPDQLAARTGRR